MYIVQGVFILECLDAIKVGTPVNIIKKSIKLDEHH